MYEYYWLFWCVTMFISLFADHTSLQEMLYKLFHTVLMYSLQEEQDGWRVWVETAAAMHAYVSKPLFISIITTVCVFSCM